MKDEWRTYLWRRVLMRVAWFVLLVAFVYWVTQALGVPVMQHRSGLGD